MKIRTKWVSEIFSTEKRLLQGASENLIEEMRQYDQEKFYNFLRMPPHLFDELLMILEPYITKQNAVREPISAKTRLELTLRYLATGDSMHTLGYLFRVSSPSTVYIISEVFDAMWNQLKSIVFPELIEDTWRQAAKDFENLWNFPHCISAVDGKLVNIRVIF